MAGNHNNGRHYLAAVVGKAWEEFSFIEVFSEAIGGFVFAIIALHNEWIGSDSAYEIILECVGCAILIPVVGFILRMLLVAPAELVKESEERKKGDKINPKSVYPAIVTTLLVISSFLVVGFSVSLKANFSKLLENPQMAEAKSLPKKTNSVVVLPTKIIATNEFATPNIAAAPDSKIIPAKTVANPPVQFENFNTTTGIEDSESFFVRANAKKEAEIEAKKEAEIQKENSDAKAWWDQHVPAYKYSLVVLRDKLIEKAKARRDGISQSEGYFQCLPAIINPQIGETNVAKIRFQKETNWDFLVTLEPKDNNQGSRKLRISSSGGLLELRGDEGRIGANISIPFKNFNDDSIVGVKDYQGVINDYLEILISGQDAYLRHTGIKSVTNNINKPK